MPRQKVTPFLWYDNTAEEAAQLYVSLFDNSRITSLNRFGEGAPAPGGTVLVVEFELSGAPFIALNGGPMFKFNEAFSMSVDCQNQQEVDFLWDKLSAGGTPGRCGWLKDRFGLSWQIVPSILTQLLGDPDREKAGRTMQAMLQMNKLDIKQLERAHAGG